MRSQGLFLSGAAMALAAGHLSVAGAQISGRHSYEAELEQRAFHQGVVFAGGLDWSCRSDHCTVDTGYASLSLQTCIELAAQVGPIKRFGRPGWRLGQNDLRWCNAYAATADSRQPGVSIGGGPGQPTKRIPFPGGSPSPPEGGAEGEGQGAVPAEPPQIERIEYAADGTRVTLHIRGANFPTPRDGGTLAVLPTRRSYCLGKCEEQYGPYESSFGTASVVRWDEDLLSIELAPFATEPYTAEQFMAQLLTMVESHYVEIRSGAGQPLASATVPISRFGELDRDVDRDGHRDRRWGGDDCDDADASVTAGCEP